MIILSIYFDPDAASIGHASSGFPKRDRTFLFFRPLDPERAGTNAKILFPDIISISF